MTVELSFNGAAGTVTGSCYRIVHDRGSFLVDCGLFQGTKTERELNEKPFPFDPAGLDFVLLTHAHIDHVGLVPRLYAKGYRGPLHATAATNGLIEYLLADGASIQESEAERENRKRKRRGEAPLPPLYTLADAEEALKHRIDHPYGEWIEPQPGVRARFWNAGHILGSASIEIEVEDGGKPVRLLFSGDLGPDEKVFYLKPGAPAGFDYVICESTYGGRDRADYTLQTRRAALAAEIEAALARGGNLVIPAFAVERSQELLHDIGTLIKDGTINPQRVFLDSPLARRVTQVFARYANEFADLELSPEQLFNDPRFSITESVEESKAINMIAGGAIIISASGMADAGRIKHHLRNNLIRHNATVLFVGHQARGTLGQVIQSGAREVTIHGSQVPVRATIRSIDNYSAHADHSELIAWIKARLPIHGTLFLTHGEDAERAALRKAAMALGLAGDQVLAPYLDDRVALQAGGTGRIVATGTGRIETSQIGHDWHNGYAELMIALSDALRAAPTDSDREAMIERLKAALAAE
ncbi:MBL fold metallo-hydrolase [Pelagibacterium halotolerans]|uniref:Metallo-beta-lactamase family protein, RNA-specific n=1 Tax=Pelagibacterium halotolerans (strain DSM 22347 / JCM 15775 / CGMCC 1.7692 / B2) TaxID=1082931 RepID=G4R8J0_PELHB|nr:MBL fold metallo-hydrolase [Pelagibacterium halotolerans]AEQ53393.1 metallo-beta-lactamase family protein, RNA-specific [Pelagibacterium halotolerans B2]QJR16999.1 MBL fold metallo-hydrolase [Pelagibacterium halotolerans]SEA61441.1 metallo-beta-lactamase family protein [Pelagibacterium halotolerans]